MRRLGVFFALFLAVASPSVAQTRPDPNPQIDIAYDAPADSSLTRAYQLVLSSKPLETLAQFLAPLKLEQRLVVRFEQCTGPGEPRRLYPARHRLGGASVCYEFVDQVLRLAPKSPVTLIQADGGTVTPKMAIAGPIVQELLHETMIAAFDVWRIPVWGRRDDAADRLAAFVLRNFGKDQLARNTILGSAFYLSSGALARPDFADERGITAQRYYTTLCIAFGGDYDEDVRKNEQASGVRVSFGAFVASLRGDNGAAGDLPMARAQGCPDEYQSVYWAFKKLVLPHLDASLMKQVMAIDWVVF